jgi:hypothetical protein
MKIAFKLLFLTLILTSCGRPQPKTATTRNLAGTWVGEFDGPDCPHTESKIVVGTDGHCISHATITRSNRVWTYDVEGTLEIKDGFLIETMTKTTQAGVRVPRTSRSQIVRMNDHELVVKCQWQENESILKRQN